MEWRPHPGPQTAFHASGAFEVLYGGAAGGGKSESLLVEALRYVHVPGYRAIYFRRTYPELEGKGSGVIPRSRELLHGVADYDEQQHIWFFHSGATLAFAHLEHEHSVHNYRSAQFAYVALDELTTFSEAQYLYLFSRCRSASADAPARIRCASNPGGRGHLWVRRRFIERLRPYEIRYFKRVGAEDVECAAGDHDALSRQFVPASVLDNPILLARDPGYLARLKALDAVERARLLEGDWFVTESGLVYGNFTDANITDEEPDPGRPIELAFDDGYMDPRALLLIQRSGTRVLVFGEIYHSQHLGETCIGEMRAWLQARGLPLPYLACGSPEAVEFREQLRRAGIRCAQRKALPVVEGIKHLRQLVCDANGYRTLQVHRRCTHLLSEIREGYRYPPLGGDVPLDEHNHALDALRYALADVGGVAFEPVLIQAVDPLKQMDQEKF